VGIRTVIACALVATSCSLFVSTGDLVGGGEASPHAAPSSDGGAEAVAPISDASETGEASVDGRVLPAGAVVWPANGHAYLVVSRTAGYDWNQAVEESRRLGGHLVTIQSADENALVFGLLGALGPGAWLGGSQPEDGTEPAGGWSWVTGEPMTYTNWAQGQPNNLGGDEDGLHYLSDGTGEWSDDDFTGRYSGFAVELE